MTGEPFLRAEHQLPDAGMLAVGADDEVDLPRCTALELDADAAIAVAHQRAHRVVEHHLDVVAVAVYRMRTRSSRMISISRSPRISCIGRSATS